MPRIIAGSARGISLLVPEGLDTRPTADSRKEAIFSSIQFDIPGSRFLDLFAGSGAAGLEALSRGAQKAVFVEAGHKAAVCIQKNMEKTRLAQNARLLEETAEQAIGRLAAEGETFDLIFLDPPYHKGYEEQSISAIAEKGLLAEGGKIVVESAADTEFCVPASFRVIKTKIYRMTKFTLLTRERGECE